MGDILRNFWFLANKSIFWDMHFFLAIIPEGLAPMDFLGMD